MPRIRASPPAGKSDQPASWLASHVRANSQSRFRVAIALSGLFALQDRFWWDPALNIVTAGIYPLLTDAGLLVVGYALGYAVMRLIAGPARNDRLAGPSSLHSC